jgi:hypothetical protein
VSAPVVTHFVTQDTGATGLRVSATVTEPAEPALVLTDVRALRSVQGVLGVFATVLHDEGLGSGRTAASHYSAEQARPQGVMHVGGWAWILVSDRLPA